jgi:hypothetical protein
MKQLRGKKQIFQILLITAAVFSFSCTGMFDLGKEKIVDLSPVGETQKTLIYFDNSENNFAVDVFSSHTRGVKVASIPAKRTSESISWIPTTDGFEFYFTYYLLVSGKEVPYIPKKYGVDFITVSIPKDRTTAVRVPKLTQVVPVNEALFDEVYLAVKNNNASSIQLLAGSAVQLPVTGLSLVNYGETAVFKLNPTNNVSNYSIKIQGNNVPLYQSGITALQSGYLYEMEVGGGTSITLMAAKLLSLNNL